jgi:hypothetical protein
MGAADAGAAGSDTALLGVGGAEIGVDERVSVGSGVPINPSTPIPLDEPAPSSTLMLLRRDGCNLSSITVADGVGAGVVSDDDGDSVSNGVSVGVGVSVIVSIGVGVGVGADECVGAGLDRDAKSEVKGQTAAAHASVATATSARRCGGVRARYISREDE